MPIVVCALIFVVTITTSPPSAKIILRFHLYNNAHLQQRISLISIIPFVFRFLVPIVISGFRNVLSFTYSPKYINSLTAISKLEFTFVDRHNKD